MSDSRKLIQQIDDKGMYSALQMGFNDAKCDFFAYVNADDVVIKEGFERMYNEAQNSDVDLVYSDGFYHWLHEDRYEKIKGRRFGRYHL